MSKTLVFDFDGTIADSIEVLVKTIAEVVPGVTKDFLTREEAVYLLDSKIQYFIKEFRLRELKLLLMAKVIRKHYAKRIPQLKPIKGIPEVLNLLKNQGNRLIILTSSPEAPVREFLKNNGIEVFDDIIGSASIFGKAQHLQKLCDKESYYIGDELRDINAGKSAGCKAVGVCWGFSKKGDFLNSSKADFVAERPADLESLN